MPTLCHVLFITFISLLKLSTAATTPDCSSPTSRTGLYVQSSTVESLSTRLYSSSLTSKTPILPINGDLPAPTAALKYVTVGRGTQNYSCSSAGSTPVAIGAVAILYDFTRLAKKNETALHEVPPTIVYQPISVLANSTEIYINHHGTFPVIGHHFFAADGTPTFDLSCKGDILFCKKVASANAPANADGGPAGTGAVPWLNLIDKGGSVGVSEVYRVVTAGGKAPTTCTDSNPICIQYAAEYWFYG